MCYLNGKISGSSRNWRIILDPGFHAKLRTSAFNGSSPDGHEDQNSSSEGAVNGSSPDVHEDEDSSSEGEAGSDKRDLSSAVWKEAKVRKGCQMCKSHVLECSFCTNNSLLWIDMEAVKLAFFNTTMETLTDTKTSDGAIDSNVNSDLVENQLNATENSNASSVVNDNKNITSYVVSTTCVNETEMEGTYCCEMCPDFDINKLNYIFICFSIIRRGNPDCWFKGFHGNCFG